MAAASPNILLVVVDDLGAHHVGAAGASGFFHTPCLNRFAAEGVSFSQAYACAPVCSPSRAGLYTGLHPARLHLTEFIPGSSVRNPPLLTPDWQRGLPVAAVTIGDVLRERGYATAHFGKWHLAPDYNHTPGRPMDPESQGFDEVWCTRKPAPDADPERDPHQVTALTERTIEFCTRPRGGPFLCVLAHNAIHRPELAPAALVRKYAAHPAADAEVNRPALGAMIEQLDRSIGRLLAALEAAKLSRNTLVVFTSDHGALGGSARRKPLRGAKADLYEGGLRIPLLIRWPDHLPAGVVRDTLVSNLDVFSTLLAAAGVPVPADSDGIDLAPALQGAAAPPSRTELCWHYPHYHHLGPGPCAAIRSGDYKLIEWFAPEPRLELFDLAADPGESCNLATELPQHCQALLGRLRAWRRDVGAQEMTPNPAYDPSRPTEAHPHADDLTSSHSP